MIQRCEHFRLLLNISRATGLQRRATTFRKPDGCGSQRSADSPEWAQNWAQWRFRGFQRSCLNLLWVYETRKDKWSGRVDSNHRPPGPESVSARRRKMLIIKAFGFNVIRNVALIAV